MLEFASHVQFRHDNIIDSNIDALRFRLANIQHPSYFLNSDCIFAKIVNADHFQHHPSKLQIIVEGFIQEAKDRSSQNAFGSDPFTRDILFQKMQKLLFELLLNVAEHSHPSGEPNYAGVYARIRTSKPPVHRDATAWLDLFEKKTLPIFGQNSFRPNHYAEWLELYVCDVGVGLTHHIKEWLEPENDSNTVEILRKAKNKTNPFISIVDLIFHAPLSRYPRHSTQRTAVTGLQDLGNLLAIDGDHCRIYTQRGSWVGDHFPWRGKQYSRRDITAENNKENRHYSNFTPVSGTAYSFSIQPNFRNLTSTPPWELIDQDGQQRILRALHERVTVDVGQTKVVWFDRCGKDNCSPPKSSELSAELSDVIVLRPPEMVNKHDVAKWLELVSGESGTPAKIQTRIMILADLTPFQILILHELLQGVVVNRETVQDWYLVSEQWAVLCLTTVAGEIRFKSSVNKAKGFFGVVNNHLPFTAADLAVLLRQMDSEIFWKQKYDNFQSPLFNVAVDWDSDHGDEKPVRLKRYLDFPLALVNSDCYRSCLRSLRRCLALFPDHKPIATDDLVISLVSEASLSIDTRNANAKYLLVGSVAVTGKTVVTHSIEGEKEYLHILIHNEADRMQASSKLTALLWISQLSNSEEFIHQHNIGCSIPWRRIPYTPYIAPMGEKSISVLRYRRNNDGSLNFDAPYYGRTPEETYNDFRRLSILKTGHWRCGSRHDLLTVNMRLAFDFSFLEKGPLHNWIIERFTEYFGNRSKDRPKAVAQLLLYPSHPITDTLFDRIRRDMEFQSLLPEGGIIPIKFVTKRTVSPLLASHLVKYRIEEVTKEKGWGYRDWAAVLLDDGTISGKHLRETTQFLQSMGAANVYTIAVLDRSGLPVQEKVLDKFLDKNKRFWRWDVPGLGNKRNCSLCQAIAIIQTYTQEHATSRQANRLSDWVNIWKLRDVDMEWYQGGLQPTALTHPLEITFGIDPERSTTSLPVEKRLSFSSSTAATSLLMELTRLTTRTDVAIKKAQQVLPSNPDAAIEIIASQLFLYIDELSPKEKLKRFKKLLEWSWERDQVTDAMSLAGLSFTLVDDDQVKTLWTYCRKELLSRKLMGNLDTILSVSILCSRNETLSKEKYKLGSDANEYEINNYLLLSKKGTLTQDIGALLTKLISNPDNPIQANTHQTLIKKRINRLYEEASDDNTLYTLAKKIVKDIEWTHELISRLNKEHILEIQEHDLLKLYNYIQSLAKGASLHVNELRAIGKGLDELLYGNSCIHGIVKTVCDQMFHHAKNFESFEDNSAAPQIRKLQAKWGEIITEKINTHTYHEWNKIDYWLEKNADGTLALRDGKPRWNKEEPIIFSSTSNINGELWFYCDCHVLRILEDLLANVLHSTDKIANPFIVNHGMQIKAHFWWCVEVKDRFLLFRTANVTKNKYLLLKERVPLACLERVDGAVTVTTEKASNETFIAYTELKLPLFKHFIGAER